MKQPALAAKIISASVVPFSESLIIRMESELNRNPDDSTEAVELGKRVREFCSICSISGLVSPAQLYEEAVLLLSSDDMSSQRLVVALQCIALGNELLEAIADGAPDIHNSHLDAINSGRKLRGVSLIDAGSTLKVQLIARYPKYDPYMPENKRAELLAKVKKEIPKLITHWLNTPFDIGCFPALIKHIGSLLRMIQNEELSASIWGIAIASSGVDSFENEQRALLASLLRRLMFVVNSYEEAPEDEVLRMFTEGDRQQIGEIAYGVAKSSSNPVALDFVKRNKFEEVDPSADVLVFSGAEEAVLASLDTAVSQAMNLISKAVKNDPSESIYREARIEKALLKLSEIELTSSHKGWGSIAEYAKNAHEIIVKLTVQENLSSKQEQNIVDIFMFMKRWISEASGKADISEIFNSSRNIDGVTEICRLIVSEIKMLKAMLTVLFESRFTKEAYESAQRKLYTIAGSISMLGIEGAEQLASNIKHALTLCGESEGTGPEFAATYAKMASSVVTLEYYFLLIDMGLIPSRQNIDDANLMWSEEGIDVCLNAPWVDVEQPQEDEQTKLIDAISAKAEEFNLSDTQDINDIFTLVEQLRIISIEHDWHRTSDIATAASLYLHELLSKFPLADTETGDNTEILEDVLKSLYVSAQEYMHDGECTVSSSRIVSIVEDGVSSLLGVKKGRTELDVAAADLEAADSRVVPPEKDEPNVEEPGDDGEQPDEEAFDEEAYDREFLEICLKEFSSRTGEIESLVKRKSLAIEDFYRVTHTLKGLCGHLGDAEQQAIWANYEKIAEVLKSQNNSVQGAAFQPLLDVIPSLVDRANNHEKKPHLEVTKAALDLSAELLDQAISTGAIAGTENTVQEQAKEVAVGELTVAEVLKETAVVVEGEGSNTVEPEEDDLDEDELEILEMMKESFREDALDQISEASRSFQRWRNGYGVDECSELKRWMHTLKGNARGARYNVIGSLTHDLETVMENIGVGLIGNPDDYSDIIGLGVDFLRETVQALVKTGQELPRPDSLLSATSKACEQLPIDIQSVRKSMRVFYKEVAGQKDRPKEQTDVLEFKERSNLEQGLLPETANSDSSKGLTLNDYVNDMERANHKERKSKTSTVKSKIKVEEGLVDRGISLSSELVGAVASIQDQGKVFQASILESQRQVATLMQRMSQHTVTVNRLLSLKSRFTGEAAILLGELVEEKNKLVAETAVVETLVRGLTDAKSEQFGSTAKTLKTANKLQRSLISARLIPVNNIFPRLKKVCEETATEVGKKARVEIIGGNELIDKRIVERITDPLLHIIRNSVDHGIEMPNERVQAGKSVEGSIKIIVQRRSDKITIQIEDDGRGLNREKIIEKALRKGVISEGEKLTDEEVYMLITENGFSTADQVSQISGRGVGMDIVMTEVRALDGSMLIKSEAGLHTKFRMEIPSDIASNNALMCRTGSMNFAIQAQNLLTVKVYRRSVLDKESQSGQVCYQGKSYYHITLAAMIGMPDCYDEGTSVDDNVPVFFCSVGNKLLCVEADEISQLRQISVKPIPVVCQQNGTTGIIGFTETSSGDVAYVVDLPKMVIGNLGVSENKVYFKLKIDKQSPIKQAREILVVDDSAQYRMAIKKYLNLFGYGVITAEHGEDALRQVDWLCKRGKLPDAIFTDAEMPKLDGFGFAEQIAGNENTKNIPMIMVTTLSDQESHRRAKSVGIQMLINKPVQKNELKTAIEMIFPGEVVK